VTVLTSDQQLLGTGAVSLPRVNLLPPEIAERRAFRRIQVLLGSAVLGSLVVVGGLYVTASHSASSAQSELDRVNVDQAQLQKQITSYRGVTALYAAAEAAQAQLTTAMSDEVRYSQLLNDVSLSVPSSVWLTNVSFSQTVPKSTATAGASASLVQQPVAAVGVPTPIGTATFQGVGFSHDDVATWLDALAGLKTYANPYFSNSTEALIGQRQIVNFTSTVTVTSAAQSGRYSKPVGG
jgi:Tfp pilus assembly protein PilN